MPHQVKAQPLDENGRVASGMFVPIVVGGDITKYLPVLGTDNGDGTATLALTTVVNPNIDIGNVNLMNIADQEIDPATEQQQILIIAAINAISAVTAGVAEHHNGTATTTPATVNFSGTSKAILIDNLDTSKNLLVSFDSGANTKTVAPGQSLSIEASHSSVDVSSSAGTVAFEMLVTV